MNPANENLETSAGISRAEVEDLLATVARTEQTVAEAIPAEEPQPRSGVMPHDFRSPRLLSARELRKLRAHQQEFADALAARFSLFLRQDFVLKLNGLQTVFYQKLAQSWLNPSHLTLFKIEPLRGVSILEIPPRLGFTMVDRLLGGAGVPPEAAQEFSDIEKALLEQAAQLALSEWCAHWRGIKELKPVVLGQESHGKYVQTAPPETIMLVVSLEARLGQCVENIQIGFPHAALEPLIRQLSQGAETLAEPVSTPAPKSPTRWNTCFDDVCVPVSAAWDGLEMTAREVLALKVGDVVTIATPNAGQLNVSVADLPRFNGRPGTLAGKWAVELTRALKD